MRLKVKGRKGGRRGHGESRLKKKVMVDLRRKDVLCRSTWSVGVEITAGLK